MKPGTAGVVQMAGAAVVLLATGALLAWWAVARADRDMRAELLRHTVFVSQALDLNDTVTYMLKILGRLIGEDIELVWKPAWELDTIRMDPAQIDQMLANLVVNARDAIGQSWADPPFPSGNETVLLVEDEPAILAMARSILEEMGYTVLAAAHPDDALRLAAGHGEVIHLLVTDVVMPSINGRELADQVRATRPDICCLCMSGYTSDIIARQGVLDEGVHFIQKPFSMRELGNKVREALHS